MHVHSSIHTDDATVFDASFVTSTGSRAVQFSGDGSYHAAIFLTDAKARELAETILAALDADAKQKDAA